MNDFSKWRLLAGDSAKIQQPPKFLNLEPNVTHKIRLLDEPEHTVAVPAGPNHPAYEATYLPVLDLWDHTPKLLSVSKSLLKRIYDSVVRDYCEQFRFPRSKKKRIRKKWAKQAKNWRPVQSYDFEVCKIGIGLQTRYHAKRINVDKKYEVN